MHRDQRCPISNPSQDGGEGRGAAPWGEHRMAGRTMLSPCALLARLQDRARLCSGGCGANRALHAMLAPWLAVPLCTGYHQRYHKTLGGTGGQLSLAFPTVGCSPPQWDAFPHGLPQPFSIPFSSRERNLPPAPPAWPGLVICSSAEQFQLSPSSSRPPLYKQTFTGHNPRVFLSG